MYVPRHSAAHQRRSPRNRTIGLALAASATLITGISQPPAAQAAGSVWDRVAACESGGNWVINTGNGYYGGLQFSASTWTQFGGTSYAASAQQANKTHQIAIAQRVLAVQGPGAWPVCGKRAGLGLANGAARGSTVSRSMTRVAIYSHLRVDGKMGPSTVREVQRWVGTTRSGIFGPSTVMALQRKVHASADGVIGAQTMRALQTTLRAPRDGARQLNVVTVKALQTYLHRH